MFSCARNSASKALRSCAFAPLSRSLTLTTAASNLFDGFGVGAGRKHLYLIPDKVTGYKMVRIVLGPEISSKDAREYLKSAGLYRSPPPEDGGACAAGRETREKGDNLVYNVIGTHMYAIAAKIKTTIVMMIPIVAPSNRYLRDARACVRAYVGSVSRRHFFFLSSSLFSFYMKECVLWASPLGGYLHDFQCFCVPVFAWRCRSCGCWRCCGCGNNRFCSDGCLCCCLKLTRAVPSCRCHGGTAIRTRTIDQSTARTVV